MRVLPLRHRAGTVSQRIMRSSGGIVERKQIVVVPDDIGGAFRASPNIDRLSKVATVEIHGERPSDAELIERVRNATVILSFRPAFDNPNRNGTYETEGCRFDSCKLRFPPRLVNSSQWAFSRLRCKLIITFAG